MTPGSAPYLAANSSREIMAPPVLGVSMGVFGLRITETSTTSLFGTSPARVPAGRRSLPGSGTFLLAIGFLLLSIKSIIAPGHAWLERLCCFALCARGHAHCTDWREDRGAF